MFPIRDHNPSNQTPYVTYALIAINVVIFLIVWPAGTEREIWNVFTTWGMIPARITSGDGLGTVVSSTFLHAGWMHLIGNMLFLWIFGDNLEEQMGHRLFLLFYLVCGVLAGLAQVLAAPMSTVPTVGASGAVAGVLGGYLLLFPRAKVDVLFIFVIFFKIFPIPAWIALGAWFALQLFNGVLGTAGGGGVAYWAHAGGFVVGFLFLLPLWLRRGGRAFWRQTDGHPDFPDAEYAWQTSRIPRVGRRK